jgi:hypothetical protein
MLHISLGVTGMIRFAFCSSLLFLASTASTEISSQSDWSGGPGVPGPVLSWGDDFSIDTGCSWSVTPGALTITTGVEHQIDGSFDYACCVHSSDIDGDGDVDVVGAALIADDICWWENADGLGSTWVEHPVDLQYNGAACVYSDDIDGDSRMDLLGAAINDDDITWWENADGLGITWIERTIDGGFDHAECVRAGDFDIDGDRDVVGASSYGNSGIKCWENIDGVGMTWTDHIIYDDSGTIAVCCDDVDGDGDLDVLGVSASDETITWWENADGVGLLWVEHFITTGCGTAYSVHSDDVDGDGDTDVLVAIHDRNDITWWENTNGIGTIWIQHWIDGDFRRAISVSSVDMDSDGDVDVLGASQFGDEITWWENSLGTGLVWIEHPVDAGFEGAHSVHFDDVDGDGVPDIIGAADQADDITWWNLDAHRDTGSMESSILYLGCDPDWGTLLWSSQIPMGTAVSFQVRASDDYTQMGAWSDTLFAPSSLHGILADNASYFEYRAILETADPDTTPTLLDVSVTWDPLGVDGGSVPSGFELLPVRPNPCAGTAGIDFGLPVAATVELSLFDISGRLVQDIAAAEYQPGWHEIQLSELSPGVFFVRMTAGEFEATQRFVVVD